jgi:transposase
MQAYSKEFRRDVLAACDRGQGTREVARLFQVSESWVRRVKQVRREQGKVAPCTTRRRIPLWAAFTEQIQTQIARQPDLTLQELKDALATSLSRQTLCKALRRLKLTLKKKCSARRSKLAPTWPSVATPGNSCKRASIRIGSCSSMKRGPKPT